MNPLALIVKFCWRLRREATSAFLLLYYKLLPGAYFKRVGAGTKFFGAVRFGNVAGNISLGNGCMIGKGVFLSATNSSFIEIGSTVSINTGCHLVAAYGITIGDHTRIGEYVSLRDQNHTFSNPEIPVHRQGFTGSAITIGKDVWIGRGVFIGSGVTIGDGCIIGANSVVTKSLPPMSIAVGAPAKVIRKRGDKLHS